MSHKMAQSPIYQMLVPIFSNHCLSQDVPSRPSAFSRRWLWRDGYDIRDGMYKTSYANG